MTLGLSSSGFWTGKRRIVTTNSYSYQVIPINLQVTPSDLNDQIITAKGLQATYCRSTSINFDQRLLIEKDIDLIESDWSYSLAGS